MRSFFFTIKFDKMVFIQQPNATQSTPTLKIEKSPNQLMHTPTFIQRYLLLKTYLMLLVIFLFKKKNSNYKFKPSIVNAISYLCEIASLTIKVV